jgi:5-(carboxyamino)imidazole ribonucleotide synthase
VLLPPSTIGVIGGGQLGLMLLREAQRMGYRTCLFDPDPECPATRIADEVVTATFDDHFAIARFAALADVITYEFENIPVETVTELELLRPLVPGSAILAVSQNRFREKYELEERGFPVVPHEIGRTAPAIDESLRNIGLPAVIKTTTAGYDGKGQALVHTRKDADQFLPTVRSGYREYVIEKFIPISCELSVIGARSRDGNIVIFPVGENDHRENILHITRVPARVPDDLRDRAMQLGRKVIESFQIVGVLCIEMFVTDSGDLIVNELAPRPHNSGHYSIDACPMSQFEALIRAACDLPLIEPRLYSPCAMINVLGKHVDRLDFDWLLGEVGVKVHLYGKKRIEPKRKMGHITVMKDTAEEVEMVLKRIEEMIGDGG